MCKFQDCYKILTTFACQKDAKAEKENVQSSWHEGKIKMAGNVIEKKLNTNASKLINRFCD